MVRFGVVGTNFISEWFVDACRASDGRAEAVAVCSRTLGRAEEFARTNGVATTFDNLAAMADAVDAVYVASPVAAHQEQALIAIEAGRHVLVEKTMGASASEIATILDAAERAGVVAMEAVRNLHAPAHGLIGDTLPRLGPLRQVRFEKLQYSSRYDRFRAGEVLNAFDPSLGNSALADIGVYVLQPALDLFGMQLGVCGASVILSNGFEAAGSMQLDYGRLVVDLAWSKITRGVNPSVIHGEDAALTVDDLAQPSRVVLHPRDGEPEVLMDAAAPEGGELMVAEVLAFVDQVEAGRTDPRWSSLTIESRSLMDAHLAREAASVR